MLLPVLKKYVWVINLLLIVAISYSIAAMINNGLREKIESGTQTHFGDHLYEEKYGRINIPYRSRDYYDQILKNNLFGEAADVEIEPTDYIPSDGDVPKTSLKLELLGTFLSEDGYPSLRVANVAVIKNMENSRIKGYSEGQWVDLVTSEKVKIVNIGDCQVTIYRAGGSELLTCGKELEAVSLGGNVAKPRKSRPAQKQKTVEAGISRVGDGIYQIEKKMFDELIAKPNNLITDARIVPLDDGIKIMGVRSRSVFYKIGLRNGDIIHQINEVALNDVQNALLLFDELRSQDEFTVDFTRRGKRRSNRYTVY